MANLPNEILELAEFTPPEDIALTALREKITSVPIQSLIRQSQTFPFILVRRNDSFGQWAGDERFLDDVRLAVTCFAEDPNGDEDAAILSEAVRVAMRQIGNEKKVFPGLGHIVSISMGLAPSRAPDWATSSGPVQYADLPTGVWRYEAEYDVVIRKYN